MPADLLIDAVARLSRAATEPLEVDGILQLLCTTAAAVLDVDAANVMAVDDGGTRSVHGTSERSRPLGWLQQLEQAGPGADSLALGADVVVNDLALEGRWPGYQRLAHELGVGAVASVPLLSRGHGWGVLDLYRHATGPWSPELLAAARLLADLAVSYVVMAHDRDEVRRARDELAHRAVHDDLTGLPNRALLLDRLEHALAVAGRNGASVAVVFLDLDDFKAVNDRHGHATGDAVLVAVAERLRSAIKAGDTLARLSGDEFVIVVEGMPDETPDGLDARVRSLADRVRAGLREPVLGQGPALVVTASIGVAVVDAGVSLPHDVIAEADAAMYAAKLEGGGAVRVHGMGGGEGASRAAAPCGHGLGREAGPSPADHQFGSWSGVPTEVGRLEL